MQHRPIRFLIAECEAPATIMGALYLARLFGVDADTAERLVAAGLGSVDSLIEADVDVLAEIEGIGAQRAIEIQKWAGAQSEQRAEQAARELTAGLEMPAASAPTMGDEDFMAALSRAFQESERQRGSHSDGPEEADAEAESAANADGDGASTDGEQS